jgi:hypothetical protein
VSLDEIGDLLVNAHVSEGILEGMELGTPEAAPSRPSVPASCPAQTVRGPVPACASLRPIRSSHLPQRGARGVSTALMAVAREYRARLGLTLHSIPGSIPKPRHLRRGPAH